MFEAAEIPPTLSRSESKTLRSNLRRRLLEAQFRMRQEQGCAVIVVLGGVDGAGKGETANQLCEWLDPRLIDVNAYDEATVEESLRPEYWRFWRDLPPSGQMSIVLSGWHHAPFLGRVYGRLDAASFERDLQRINDFEATLARDGVLIVKFWMHLGRQQQHDRFRRLERDPLRCWRVTEMDWRHWHMYDDFVAVSKELIGYTSTDAARWALVPGAVAEQRDLVVGGTLLDALEARLDTGRAGGQGPGQRFHEVRGDCVGPLLP